MAFLSLKGLPSTDSSTPRTLYVSVGKVVNPLGTVTTITESPQESIIAANEFSEEYSSGAYIHENCDESMFRPYVAVISGTIDGESDQLTNMECERPEPIGQKLIVPVIDATQLIRNKEKARQDEYKRQQAENEEKFIQMSLLNKKEITKIDTTEKEVSLKEKTGTEKMIDLGKKTEKYSKKDSGVLKKVEDSPKVETIEVKPIAADRKNLQKERESVEKIIVKEPKSKEREVVEKIIVKELKSKSNVETLDTKAADSEIAIAKLKKRTSKISAKFTEPIALPDEPKSIVPTKQGKKSENIEIEKTSESFGVSMAELMHPAFVKKSDIDPNEEQQKKMDSVQLKSEISNRKRDVIDERKPKPLAVNDVAVPQKPLERSNLRDDDSKESSVEKEINLNVQEENSTGKRNNRRQKKKEKLEKVEKLLNDKVNEIATMSSVPAQADATEEITEFTFNLKNSSKANESRKSSHDFAILDVFENAKDSDCSKIQESLLKNPVVTATVSVRKGSIQDKDDFVDITDSKTTTKSNKKSKKNTKDIDLDSIVPISPHQSAHTSDETEFTFTEAPEPTTDLDSLSFKSTTDDPISLINFESPLQETSESVSLNDRTNDFDKLSDDIELCTDGQFSDCKPFQLVIDETETYLKSSDTNSSDETEDSSQGKSTKSEKTLDDDDELQPLIDSATSQSDTAVESTKSETLPDEINQSDSMKQPQHQQQKQLEEQEQQQQQQQNQQQQNQQQNNKKKFRKKRR